MKLRKFVKLFAFTLAETLIVIGVIGIVSALTLPNLNSSTGEKEKVAKVKKIYQNLQDAFGRAEAVYGPYDEWIKTTDTSNELKAKRVGERITEFMKISKNCQTGSGCFNTNSFLKLYSGEVDGASCDSATSYYKVITSDGTSIGLTDGGFIVDIDGPSKGKNTWGLDIFKFVMLEGSISPEGHSLNGVSALVTNIRGFQGHFAAKWIIDYDNADYLQLVDITGKCKNGNTVSDANPSCK